MRGHREKSADALAAKISAVELADAHLAQDDFLVALNATGIDFEAYVAIRLSPHICINGTENLGPAATFWARVAILRTVIGLGSDRIGYERGDDRKKSLKRNHRLGLVGSAPVFGRQCFAR